MLFYFAPSGLGVDCSSIGGLHPPFEYDALSGLENGVVRMIPIDPDASVLQNKVANTGIFGGVMP